MKKAYLISCFDNYDSRIKYWESFLKDKQYDVNYITSNFDHITKKKLNDKSDNKVIIDTISYKKNISPKRIISHIIFSYKVYKYLYKIEKDFVYVILPPNFLLFFISKLKKKENFILVGDIFDLWPETFPVKKKWFLETPFKVWANLRNKSLEKLDYLITECNLYQSELKFYTKNIPKKTLYLTKEFSGEEFNLKEKEYEEIRKNTKKAVIKLCYLGSINNILDIDLLISLIKEIQKKQAVELIIIGEGEKKLYLLDLLKNKDINFKYHGAIFDDVIKQQILSCCDYGLNLMKDEVTVGLTMKSMDYFAAGLPIINSIKGDTLELIGEYEAGVNIERSNLEQSVKTIINQEPSMVKRNVKKMHSELFSNDSFYKKLEIIFNEIEEESNNG